MEIVTEDTVYMVSFSHMNQLYLGKYYTTEEMVRRLNLPGIKIHDSYKVSMNSEGKIQKESYSIDEVLANTPTTKRRRRKQMPIYIQRVPMQ